MFEVPKFISDCSTDRRAERHVDFREKGQPESTKGRFAAEGAHPGRKKRRVLRTMNLLSIPELSLNHLEKIEKM